MQWCPCRVGGGAGTGGERGLNFTENFGNKGSNTRMVLNEFFFHSSFLKKVEVRSIVMEYFMEFFVNCHITPFI